MRELLVGTGKYYFCLNILQYFGIGLCLGNGRFTGKYLGKLTLILENARAN